MQRRRFILTAVAAAVATTVRFETSADGETFYETWTGLNGFNMDASVPPSPLFRISHCTIEECGLVRHEGNVVRVADIFDLLAAEYKDRWSSLFPPVGTREGWRAYVRKYGWDTIHREHDATLDLYWVQFSKTLRT